VRSWEYGDPLRVMMSREAHTCKGCKYKEEMYGREYCDHEDNITGKLKGRSHCKHYDEGVKDAKGTA
jgi:hypothetical protein